MLQVVFRAFLIGTSVNQVLIHASAPLLHFFRGHAHVVVSDDGSELAVAEIVEKNGHGWKGGEPRGPLI